MNEYRFRWQTWVGIILLLLLIGTVILPGISIENKTNKQDIRYISSFVLAKWTLNVDSDSKYTEELRENIDEDKDITVPLRLWGWLIYLPFILAIISIVFMLVCRRTYSGMLLTNGIISIICECVICFIIPSVFEKEGLIPGASCLVVIMVALLIVIYSVLCMTIWRPAVSKNRVSNKYDYVFQENPEVIKEVGKAVQSTPIRQVGMLKGLRGEYTGMSLEIHMGEEIILGRDPRYCMLIFSNPRVSRRQCGIRYDTVNGYYLAIDYSSNGTTLSDGTLLTTSEYTPLRPGTVIYLANGEEELILV